MPPWLVVSLALAAMRALLAAPAAPQPAAPPLASTAERAGGCAAWDVDYLLDATVELSDTMMGAGNGVHAIGPGSMTLRFEDRSGQPGGAAKMLSYLMTDRFDVAASVLFWGTSVANDTHTTVTPDAAGVAAEGLLSERTLRWTGPVRGMRTDGAVTCTGAFCGKFGAPPEGTSGVHTPPHPVEFMPFEFDAEKKSFTMAWSIVSKMESPRQTSRIALVGHEVHRTCAALVQPQ